MRKTKSSQVVEITEIVLPPGIQLKVDQELDGRWLAVIDKYPGVMAYGNTKDEAAGHAIELLLSVLDERASFADYLASIPVEDEEITPEFAAELDRARASLDRGEGVPHEEILREFGFTSED